MPLRPQHFLGDSSGGLTPQGNPLPLDVHLMIEQPELYSEDFHTPGRQPILCTRNHSSFGPALAMIRELGAEAGRPQSIRRRRWMLSEVLDKSGYGIGDEPSTRDLGVRNSSPILRENPPAE